MVGKVVRLAVGQRESHKVGDSRTDPERSRVWDADWQVGNNGKETVCKAGFEGKVVRDLVDGQEEVLVGGSTNDVGSEPEAP